MSVPAEAPTFSPKTANALQNAGFVIVTSEGTSIQGQRDKGRKFWSRVHEGDKVFEALTCEPSQFAYHPEQLILLKSEGRSLEEVAEVLNARERQLRYGSHIPGRFRVDMLTMQEALAVMFDSMDQKRPVLTNDYIQTATHHRGLVFSHGRMVEMDQIVVVGLSMPNVGPSVTLWLPEQVSPNFGFATKIVPL